MAALTADRSTPTRDGIDFNGPVAAAKEIFMGSLVVRDASGNIEPGTLATGKVAMGRAMQYVDNSGGAAGAKTIEIRAGIFRWANSATNTLTRASIGDAVYIEDDQTVGSLATGMSTAGTMVDIDSAGVWVKTFPPEVLVSGLTAANNLSDVASATTSATNLGLGTGDTPQFTGVIPGPGTASILKTAKTSVTAAQLKALAATPITVVAAVASKMHVPVGFHLKLEYGSEVLVEPSAPDEIQFKYVDGSGVACTAELDAGEIIVPAADAYAYAPAIAVEGGTLAQHVNVPIVIHNTGGEYTGNASNDTVLEVTALYFEVDVS